MWQQAVDSKLDADRMIENSFNAAGKSSANVAAGDSCQEKFP